MLKSRTIADQVVEKFELRRVYGEERLSDARKELARKTTIAASRDGVISIEVEDKEPRRAAEIANGYIEGLRRLTVGLAVSEAAQRRLFFEGQLRKAKNDLIAAETELKRFTLDAGLVNPQGQIGLSVAAAASLRAQISAKEIQLSTMRTFATEGNPDLKRTIQELTGLRTELGKLEKATGGDKGDVMVPFGKAPEIGLEYIRRYRDMRYSETLYEVLAKQYEVARIDEAKDATLIQVLDSAIEPETYSRPRRLLILFVALCAAGVMSVVIALGLERIKRAKNDPRQRAQLDELKRLLHLSH